MLRNSILIMLCSLIIFSCSGVSDKDLYDSAKSKYDEGNYVEALHDYENLIKEFPDTEYRSEVLFEIGKMYHGEVVKTLTKVQNFRKAILNYKKVFNEFPANKEAPNSLFMIGFLNANELQDLDSAKYYYNLFLEKYPQNEMAVSARAEIENLGVPAEEILKKNAARDKVEK